MPKLEVGDVNDPLEHEADAIADWVMRMPAPSHEATDGPAPEPDGELDGKPEDEEFSEAPTLGAFAGGAALPGGLGSVAQRKCAACEAEEEEKDDKTRRSVDESIRREVPGRKYVTCSDQDAIRRACANCGLEGDEEIQRETGHLWRTWQPNARRATEDALIAERAAGRRGGDVSQDFDSRVRSRVRSSGRSLPVEPRRFLETRLGVDLEQVRVHADTQAGLLARAINARAFTLGKHIFFASGEWRPRTSSGMRLLAHEIAHTLQNHGGGFSGAGADETSNAVSVRRWSPDEYQDARDFLQDEIDTARYIADKPGATPEQRAKWLRYKLLLDAIDFAAVDDFDEFRAETEDLFDIADSEAETLDEFGGVREHMFVEPAAFPDSWADTLAESFILEPSYETVTMTVAESWSDLQDAADYIPEYLVEHGLPVAFETALSMMNFKIDRIYATLPDGHAIRIFLDYVPYLTQAFADLLDAEQYIEISDNLVDIVRSGKVVVNADEYDDFAMKPNNLFGLLNFSAVVLGRDLDDLQQRVMQGGAPIVIWAHDHIAADQFVWSESVEPTFDERLAQADALIADSLRSERSWYAAKWAWEHDYGLAAALLAADRAADSIIENFDTIAWMGTVVIAAQFFPLTAIAVDVAGLAFAVVNVLDNIERMDKAEDVVRGAKTVVDLQRAAAQRHLVDIEGGAQILLDIIGGWVGVRSIRTNVKIYRNQRVRPRSPYLLTQEYHDWFWSLNSETRQLLRDNPGLRAILEDAPPDVRRLLTSCEKQLCIPTNVRADDITAIRDVLRSRRLDPSNEHLKEYSLAHRDNLQEMVRILDQTPDAELNVFRRGTVESKDTLIFGAAQSPRSKPWKKNPDGKRTLRQAIEIAEENGIEVPEYVSIVLVDKVADGATAEYAQMPTFSKPAVKWKEDLLGVGNKVIVRMSRGVLDSDEAIIATIAHEMHEITELFEIFRRNNWELESGYFGDLIRANNPGNLHCEAWDEADDFVFLFREQQKKGGD